MGWSASRSLFAGLVAAATAVSGVAVAAAEPLAPGSDTPTVGHHEAVEVRVVEPAESPVRPGVGGPELTKRELGGLGVGRAGGEATEPDGTVHVLDAADGTVVTAPKGNLDRARTESVEGADASGFGAIAYNPADDRLYAADSDASTIYALDDSGRVTDTYALSDPSVSRVASMEFAPTADTTDDPAATSLFLSQGTDPATDPVTEVSLTLAAQAVAVTAIGTRVKRTLTSLWSPPSPDPSDITYIPSEGRLFVTDAEVEEMTEPQPPMFQGVNSWRVGLDGSPDQTGLTTAFSKEPAGLAYDSTRDKMIVADDDTKRIYTVSRGPDGLFMTADDGVESFVVTVPGISKTDPESVAVDTSVSPNRLYVLDALNSEVYRYSLEGTLLDAWDVGQYGTVDPEALAYDKSRDLLLMVDDSCKAFELTKTAELINVIDLTGAARCKKSAGIVIAPASSGNGKQSMYIVDRGTDNNVDPLENDGILDELSSPTLPRVGNKAPVVGAGADQMVLHGGPASLAATATDDGNFSPMTYAWAQVSGPGTTTFSTPTAKATNATFSKAGSYVLKFSAYDGDVTSTDTVTVTSNLAPTVNAGPDKSVPHPNAVSLTATASDDGNPGPLTYAWSKVSGPGTTSFTAPAALSTQATFGTSGTYVLKFEASDGHASTSDTVVVASNGAPVVDAGPDRSVTLPAGATLSGSAVDDGLPNPPGSLTVSWSKVSGPGTVTFGNGATASTTASFSSAGSYVLRLTGNDSARSSSDDVSVTVGAAPPAPTPPPTTAPPTPAPGPTVAGSPADATHAVAPRRILDTAKGVGAPRGTVGARETLTVRVQGRAGVPRTGVDTVMLNITVDSPRRAGFLTLWASQTSQPSSQSLVFDRRRTTSKLVEAEVGANGRVSIYNGSRRPVHLLGVTEAWTGPQAKATDGGTMNRLRSYKVLDTRGTVARMDSDRARKVQVTGTGGVPSNGVDAVVLVVKVLRPSSDGMLAVVPKGRVRPRTPSIAFDEGTRSKNRVVVPVSGRGTVKLALSAGDARVVVKVVGWVSAVG
jgi:hypothetical protein